MFTQQFGNALMELNVVIHIARPRFYGGDQRQLLGVNVFYQLRVVVIAVRRPGTGQVSRVAVILRPGVQQETAHFRRCAVIQLGVMQHGRVFVQRHDIAVRDIGIAVSGGGQIRQVDIKLAHA